MNLLAGDIGGTKTLLAIYKWEGGLNKQYQKKYRSSEWNSFYEIISDFISKIPRDIENPSHGCIAVAGRVVNKFCEVTNLDWEINSDKILETAKLKSFELINDFSVLLHGIKYFNESQYINIQGQGEVKNLHKNNLIAILGAGTGLGFSRGLISPNEIKILPSEGGHREFAPRTEKEWELSQWLKKDLNLKRLSLEKIVSGTGLGNIARWRLMQDDAKEHSLRNFAENYLSNHSKIDFAEMASNYSNSGDKLMREALNIWLNAYGSAAGDLAIQELCYGGLWIAGGATIKQIKGIKSMTFLKSFRNKGRFSDFVEKLPVMALIDPESGLFSAGCRAYFLANEMRKLSE